MAARTNLNVEKGKQGFQRTQSGSVIPTTTTTPHRISTAIESIRVEKDLETAYRAFTKLSETPLTPAQRTSRWWSSLSPRQQELLERNHPHVLSNRDGIPFQVRDRINRKFLDADVKRISSGVVDDEEYMHFVMNIREALHTPGRRRTLVRYHPEHRGDGFVVIGCGEVDSPDVEQVAVVVPGFRGRPERRIGSLVSDTDHVLDETRPLGGGAACGFAWIGYRTPGVRQLPSLSAARKGAVTLQSFVEGVDTQTSARVTIVGHSYGGVVAALAGNQSSQVDRVVLVGAPGAPIVADGKASKVFVVTASDDRIAAADWFSPHNPQERGGRLISIEGQPGSELNHGHNSYFQPGGAAVRAIGDVVAGRTPDNPPARRSAGGWGSRVRGALRKAAAHWEIETA